MRKLSFLILNPLLSVLQQLSLFKSFFCTWPYSFLDIFCWFFIVLIFSITNEQIGFSHFIFFSLSTIWMTTTILAYIDNVFNNFQVSLLFATLFINNFIDKPFIKCSVSFVKVNIIILTNIIAHLLDI